MKQILAYETLNGKRFTKLEAALLEEVQFLTQQFALIVPVHGTDEFIDAWFERKRAEFDALYAKVVEYRQSRVQQPGKVIELKQAA